MDQAIEAGSPVNQASAQHGLSTAQQYALAHAWHGIINYRKWGTLPLAAFSLSLGAADCVEQPAAAAVACALQQHARLFGQPLSAKALNFWSIEKTKKQV
jgi:hypothetical protein